MNRRMVILGVTSLTVLGAAFGTVGFLLRPSAHSAVPTPAAAAAAADSDASWTNSYSSIDQVKKQATQIIIGRVEGTRTVAAAEGATPGPDTLSASIFRVRVTRALKGGARVQSTVSVRQIGTPTEPALPTDEQGMLKVGQSYVLFLEPFYFHPGVSTGQYVVVGGEAAFSVSGNQAVRTTTRDGLPNRVAVSWIVDQATRK